MANVLFVDTVCPTPYDPALLASTGLGGSEASVVRIAEFLGAEFTREGIGVVAVAQRGRIEYSFYNACYGPLSAEWATTRWDVVVAFRDPALLATLQEQFPGARLILWLQDLADQRLFHPAIAATRPLVVTVSEFHRANVVAVLSHKPPTAFPRIVRIYNPIDDHLNPADICINPNKLVFFSSPNKGLAWTIQTFADIRRTNSRLELYVANPGYKSWEARQPLPDGVHNLGVLSHSEVLRHVRESLCVFYLNHVYPETFGCVFAEANAVGTPVLTHPFGAASEVLSDPRQLVDARDKHVVLQRLESWHDGGRPSVVPDERFRVACVGRQWRSVLNA